MSKIKKSYNILLVEDEIIIAVSEKSSLETLGHRVISAHSGAEAIGIMDKDSSIDVILMDVDLGAGLGGVDTAAAILENHYIPIIFLYSHDDEAAVEKAFTVPAYGYIVKSSCINMINTSILTAVKLFRQRMELQESNEKLSLANKKLELANLELDRNERRVRDREDLVVDTEKKFRGLFEILPDCVFIHDTSWRLLDYHIPENSVFPDEFRGKIGFHLSEVLNNEDNLDLPDLFISMVEDLKKGEKSKSFEYDRVIGNERYFFESRVFLADERIYVILRNITERKTAEQKLVESEKNFRRYLENFKGIAFQGVVNKGLNFIYGAVEEITGYREDELTNESGRWMKVVHPSDRRIYEELIEQLANKPGLIITHEYRILKKDGSERWIHATVNNISDKKDDDISVFGMVIDITERKEMEESLRDNRTMLAQTEKLSKTGSFRLDLTTMTSYWSDEIYCILNMDKYTEPLDFASAIDKYLVHDEDKLKAAELYKHIIDSGEAVNIVEEINVDGVTKYIDIRAFPKRDESGRIVSIFGYFQDITRIWNAEDSLKKAAQANEELLRELQHRAKNSFNMVYSMIRLTAHSESDKKMKEVLLEVAGRIRAVSEMYDLLYQTDSVEDVELHKYIKRVSSSLPIPSGKIKVVEKLEPVTIAVKAAIPIGIIIVELMTNSVKHAFEGKDSGTIEVSLVAGSECLEITISDDGIGMEENFESVFENSLGLKLVKALVDTIRGSISVKSAEGTAVTVTVPFGSTESE